MINLALAKERGLSKNDVKDLAALHMAMNSLEKEWGIVRQIWPGDKMIRKSFRQIVRRIEYQMQRLWGFEEDKTRHTHYKRFEGLRKS